MCLDTCDNFLLFLRIPPLSESLQSLDREVNKIRGDVEELKVTFSGFGDLLGKLGSGRNLSDTSELTATFRGLKALLKIFSTGRNQSHTSRGTGTQPQGKRKVILRRKKKPVTSTGPGTRGQTRKYVRLPRLRLPVGGAQRNFSPRTCDFVPISSLCSFIVLTLSFSMI